MDHFIWHYFAIIDEGMADSSDARDTCDEIFPHAPGDTRVMWRDDM